LKKADGNIRLFYVSGVVAHDAPQSGKKDDLC